MSKGEEIKKRCVKHLRRVAKKAGANPDNFTDDEIWSMWWEVCSKE